MTELHEALHRLAPQRILVYGDLLLDEYLFGRSDRLSPEKPVPVVEFQRRDHYLGGAGNVLRNLRSLGCEPVLVALVGDDAVGDECRAQLARDGLSDEGLVVEPGRTTPRKLRVHAGQHALVRIDYEDPEGGSDRSYEMLDAALIRLAPGCDAAIVSDYRKGAVTAAGVRLLVTALAGAPTVADPKGGDIERYRGVSYLLPNERELAELLGGAWDDTGAEALRDRMGLKALVLTRSDRGVRLYDGGPPRDIPARAREVFDVTGAGDTFAAAFTAFTAGGESLDVAARLANAAAGVKVRKVGTATVTRAEVESELWRDEPPRVKRIDREAAAAAAAKRRAAGQKVVFTNGCFDLLHVGHIKYLEASRSEGDCLLVGLNTDRSVRRMKGPGRPILEESERAEILAALACVDYVVLFDEDTPRELIEAIRPDVLTKGTDYEPDAIIGADIVASYGGRVERIEIVEGKSTTGIIARITEMLRG